MPQMAPMMWNAIFLSTSLILMVTLSKSYFVLGSKETSNMEGEKTEKLISNKEWMW
uniref:ATP synthase F0 subunit 8 n=1 Tax=Sminthurus viridis TaxID=109609 RepID=B2BS89_SMIVR|nr:ATP synthase F0 subunit 8 [Sminthurus viridis]ABS82045.1 ATP synthase F0 subunit 8 [Sminthurus viridis]